jgi:hypothetical protein
MDTKRNRPLITVLLAILCIIFLVGILQGPFSVGAQSNPSADSYLPLIVRQKTPTPTPTRLPTPVYLLIDDGSMEDLIGIGGTWEFIFVNRFTPAGNYPFKLNYVKVYFGSEGGVKIGDSIKIVVYENKSGNSNPAIGSTYKYGYNTTVTSVNAWNTYTLPSPVTLNGPGDVILGVIALKKPGNEYFPASIDLSSNQHRSWSGWWSFSPPPNPPVLPPNEEWVPIDQYFVGNWMVRGGGVKIVNGEEVVLVLPDETSDSSDLSGRQKLLESLQFQSVNTSR